MDDLLNTISTPDLTTNDAVSTIDTTPEEEHIMPIEAQLTANNTTEEVTDMPVQSTELDMNALKARVEAKRAQIRTNATNKAKATMQERLATKPLLAHILSIFVPCPTRPMTAQEWLSDAMWTKATNDAKNAQYQALLDEAKRLNVSI